MYQINHYFLKTRKDNKHLISYFKILLLLKKLLLVIRNNLVPILAINATYYISITTYHGEWYNKTGVINPTKINILIFDDTCHTTFFTEHTKIHEVKLGLGGRLMSP